jgi:hypothetical protein
VITVKYIRFIGLFVALAACVALAGSALAGSSHRTKAPVSSSEIERTTESETGQAGEPASGGHEDPVGQDVNHDCTGNCQE